LHLTTPVVVIFVIMDIWQHLVLTQYPNITKQK